MIHVGNKERKITRTEPFVFIPNLSEVICGRLRLRYSTVSDVYYRDYEDTINQNTTNTKAEWAKAVFEAEGIQRHKNDTYDEVYLDRKSTHERGFISWKFDFSSSGLVVETVQVDIEAIQMKPGEISLQVTGDENTINHDLKDEVNKIRVTDMEGSTTLLVKVSISADKPGCFSKLFLQSTAARKVDCPLDINIRLKRPNLALGRSLLLLGLMFSKEQLVDVQKRPWRRRPPTEFDKGFFYIYIHQAKRLPRRTTGALPDSHVKCKLLVGDRSLSCKTLRARKSVDPVWDEQHVIEGISLDQLQCAKLQITIMHETRTINKNKRKEILGTSNISSSKWADVSSIDEDVDLWNVSSTKLTELDRSKSARRGTFQTDIMDLFVNGSDKTSSSFNEQSNFISLNKNISVSLTSLQSAAKSSISEIHDNDDSSSKGQFKWKRFGNVLSRHKKHGRKGNCKLKRPSIVLSNSQETVVVLNLDSKEGEEILSDDSISTSNDERETSKSINQLSIANVDEHRRATLSPAANDDGLLTPFSQVQKIAELASNHWEMLFEHKEEWIYCWHPLSLR